VSASAAPAADDLTAVEGFFRRSGLPHLTDDARGRDTTLRWRLPAGALVLVVAVVLVARTDLGPLALASSLVGVALATALIVWVLFDLGALSLIVHQWRPALDGLAATASVALRALPPLLAVLLFLSLAQETWRAFGRLEGWRFGFVLILFGLLSAVILVAGLRRERRALMAPEPGEQMREDAMRTPAAALVRTGVTPAVPPLERPARLNVAVALVVSLGIRVLAVGVAVGLTFALLGILIVDRGLTGEWVGETPNVFVAVDIQGREVVLTEALVRVAAMLGGFASLYFVAVALGDSRNREEFLDDELERMRRVMAAWAYYRGALAAGASPSDTYQSTVRRSDSSSGV
jgi:hypothetical protein